MKKWQLVIGVFLWAPLNAMYVAQPHSEATQKIALVLEHEEILTVPVYLVYECKTLKDQLRLSEGVCYLPRISKDSAQLTFKLLESLYEYTRAQDPDPDSLVEIEQGVKNLDDKTLVALVQTVDTLNCPLLHRINSQVVQEKFQTKLREEAGTHPESTNQENVPLKVVSTGVKAVNSIFGYLKSTFGCVRKNSLKALTVLLAFQNRISSVGAALMVTNADQNLTYKVSGSTVKILPITFSGTEYKCSAHIAVDNSLAGYFSNSNPEHKLPKYSNSLLIVAPPGFLNHVFSTLAFNTAANYNHTITLTTAAYIVPNTQGVIIDYIRIRPSNCNEVSTQLKTQSPVTTIKKYPVTIFTSINDTGLTGTPATAKRETKIGETLSPCATASPTKQSTNTKPTNSHTKPTNSHKNDTFDLTEASETPERKLSYGIIGAALAVLVQLVPKSLHS